MAERHLRGWLPDVPDHRDLPFRLAAPRPAPPTADVGALVNPAPDQSTIGSCVGNSSSSGLEAFYRRAGKGPVDFSRLFVYWHARLLGGFPTSQDTGCYIRDAMKVLAKYGACFEATWPYDISKYTVQPPPAAIAEAEQHQVLYYYRCADLDAIRASIGLDGFPVVGGFSVPDSIYSAETTKTGVVRYPAAGNKILGGHAVLFVGYDDTKRLLKFQNSWGTGWGQGGFGYLPYEFMLNGLADDFWTIRDAEIPAPAPPPPPPPLPPPAPRPTPTPLPRRKRRGFVRPPTPRPIRRGR